jgi:Leucine-rich repeat (LRR) protein
MKQIRLWNLLSLLVLSLVMFSCTRDNLDEDDENSSSHSDNQLKEGQIELKGIPNSSKKMSFIAKANKITIDWGDGSKIDELTPNGTSQTFSHEYANENFQTILINVEKLTSFSKIHPYKTERIWKEVRIGSCPNLETVDFNYHILTVLDIKNAPALTSLDCSYNQLTSLDVSKCPALTYLNCCANQLTSLDVSKCPALTYLGCCSNQLTASALNSLFKSLPTIGFGYISSQGNPGNQECDRTIATNKGWQERY